MTQHVDVLIIGAGLSGIGAACHLIREQTGSTYAILERRENIGGTWDEPSAKMWLGADQIGALTTDQLAALGTAQFAALSARQIAAITDAQAAAKLLATEKFTGSRTITARMMAASALV